MSTNPPIREPLQRIATRLKEARARSGISRELAADRAGIPARTLRSWENGESTQPAWVIPVLAAIYSVSTEWLLAPDEPFLALIDTAAEHGAVTAGSISRFDECSQMASVVVTDRLVPVTSGKEWRDRMENIAKTGDRLRGKKA